jgi:hypothetical protein
VNHIIRIPHRDRNAIIVWRFWLGFARFPIPGQFTRSKLTDKTVDGLEKERDAESIECLQAVSHAVLEAKVSRKLICNRVARSPHLFCGSIRRLQSNPILINNHNQKRLLTASSSTLRAPLALLVEARPSKVYTCKKYIGATTSRDLDESEFCIWLYQAIPTAFFPWSGSQYTAWAIGRLMTH